jgi:hypothetical protein
MDQVAFALQDSLAGIREIPADQAHPQPVGGAGMPYGPKTGSVLNLRRFATAALSFAIIS